MGMAAQPATTIPDTLGTSADQGLERTKSKEEKSNVYEMGRVAATSQLSRRGEHDCNRAGVTRGPAHGALV